MARTSQRGIIAKAVIAASLLSIAEARAQQRPSLLLITVDTLRADYLSSLNSRSPVTTTAMDGLAKDGILFLRAWTTNPVTLPAHASLMTGTWPPAHGVRDFTGYRLDEERITLAETLRGQGYRTAAFVSAAVLDRRTGIAQGFDLYDDGFESFLGEDSRVAQRPGKETLSRARRWIELNGQAPFFLWVHLYEPHDPYSPPQPFLERFQENPYAGEVAYTDSLLGEFFAFLRSRGLFDEMLICLLSDHGEGLGEHGESRHGFFVYDSTARIPWIIKLPGGRGAARRVEDNVSIVDAFPTLLHGLGIAARDWPRFLQGRSRYREAKSRPSFVYIESLTPHNQFGWSDLRALVSDGYKYIAAPASELYNLREDPLEGRNLRLAKSALASQLSELLHSFESRFSEASGAMDELDPELQDRLRSLGYVGSPTARIPRESREGLADPKSKIEAYELMQRGVDAARQSRWKSAIASLEAAARQAPEAPAIASSLALACRDAGQTEKAIEWLGKTLKLTPEDSYIRLQLARLLLNEGRSDEAGDEFSLVLATDPDNFQALFNLGVHRARRGDLLEASSLFERALRIKSDAETARMLGLTLFRLGNLRQAEKAFLEALDLLPNSPMIHAHLAELYQRLGESEKALWHRERSRGRDNRQ